MKGERDRERESSKVADVHANVLTAVVDVAQFVRRKYYFGRLESVSFS